MKRVKRIFLIPVFALMMVGCRENSESNIVTGNVTFRSVVKDEIATRSSIDVDDSAITTIVLSLYDNLGRLAESHSVANGADISLDLPVGISYTLYALANVTGFTPPALESEMEEVCIDWPGVAGMTSVGFPMSHKGTFTVAQGNNTYTVDFTRLVARYDLIVDRSNMEGSFEVTGVKLRNSAAHAFPFSAKAATQTLNGDIATISDIQRVNSGSSVSFYMFENLQGILLPNNKDPWSKIPDNIPLAKDLCTFIEIEGEYMGGGVSTGLNSEKMTFRIYLGADNTSSFDIMRNTIQTLTLFPSDNSISAQSWKVDPGIVEDNRSIGWEPLAINLLSMGKDTATLQLSPTSLPVILKGSTEFENGTLHFSREGEKVIISSTTNNSTAINATLTASTLDLKKSSTLQITVAPAVSVTQIIVEPSSLYLYYGKSEQLAVTAVWSDGSTSDVTEYCSWDNSIPGAALLSSSGMVTNIYSGSEDYAMGIITAEYMEKNAIVFVKCYRSGYLHYSYLLNLDPTSATLSLGTPIQITATLTTTTFIDGVEIDSSYEDVTNSAQWSSLHPEKATVSAGAVTTLSTGTAVIMAKHSGETEFTFLQIIPQSTPIITSLTLYPTSATITATGSQSFIATATYSDGTMGDITSLCSWSSSDTGAATISNGMATGCNTASSTKTTIITATYSGMSATANLSVEGITKSPTALSISASPATIEWNGTALLTAGVTWSDGSVTTESDISYIILSGEEYVYNYQVEEGTLRGNNSTSTERSITIRGTYTYGGVVLTNTITVIIQGKESVTPSAIVLYMNRNSIAQGDSPCILSAMVTYSDGSTETFTSYGVTYSLEGENVSFANLTGNTIEASNGSNTYKQVTVRVTYSSGGATVTDSRTLNVRPKYPVSINITPSNNNFTSPSGVALSSGQSISFSATAMFNDGSIGECTSSSIWTITVLHSDGGTRVISGNTVSYSQLFDEEEYTITGVTVTASYTTDDGLQSTTATGTLSGLITLQ